MDRAYFFTVAMAEIGDLADSRDAPGEDVEQVQGLNGVEVGEYGVDPPTTAFLQRWTEAR